MPKTIHEANAAVHETGEHSPEQLLLDVALKIDDSNPEYLSRYVRVEGLQTQNVELYISPEADDKKLRSYGEILGQEIDRVNRFFGINPKHIARTVFVIGTFDKEAPDGYHGACARQLEAGGKIQPVVYAPDYRLEFGGSESTSALVRHEYLHSIDHILGEDLRTFSNLKANQIAHKIFGIFPGLDTEYYEDEAADYMEVVLWHMKHRHILPAADDLTDIVGETRVLAHKPVVGHPKDDEEEFLVSMLNVMCDEQFDESVARMPTPLASAIGELYPFVDQLVRQRVEELGLAA